MSWGKGLIIVLGLMQLMPGTAAPLGVRDPFDVRENILAGCRYFRQLLDYFQGNVPLALAGYNRVISTGCQVPAIKETQEFVTQVMGLYYLLEKHVSGLSRLGWFYTLQFMDRDHGSRP